MKIFHEKATDKLIEYYSIIDKHFLKCYYQDNKSMKRTSIEHFIL